jgi:hypothetical protein
MEDKLLGLLGLARRAGKTTCGADAVRRDIQSGRARAVLLSNDASPRTAGGIQSACEKKRHGVLHGAIRHGGARRLDGQRRHGCRCHMRQGLCPQGFRIMPRDNGRNLLI